MIRTITDKLVATVVEVTDLGALFPASVLRGRVALDVRVQRGSLCMGKRVRLSGPASEEEVQIEGIEMLHNAYDPTLIRILCSKPKTLALPSGKVAGWNIAED